MLRKIRMADMGDGHDGEVSGTIEINQLGIFLKFDGYGNCNSEENDGEVIWIEFYEGELRVLVWGDINKEDATHRISLEGALESKRKD